MTKDILIFDSFRPKNFLYLVIRHKKGLYLSSQFFWFFFRLLTYINPNILMGAKQWRRALLLLRPFEPFSFYTRHTTQKIYHHHHHPSDHHHSHNSHHTTYIPNPCNKPIRDKLQRVRVIFYCLITYLMYLKMIREIGQGAWFSGHCLFLVHILRSLVHLQRP